MTAKKAKGETDPMVPKGKGNPIRFWFQPEFEGDLRMGAVRIWAGNKDDGYESLGTMRMNKGEFDAWKKAHGGEEENGQAKVIEGVKFYWRQNQPND